MRRLLPFLALAALLAGCGSASKTSSTGGSVPAGASIVRTGVVAFVSVDSDTGSSQWQQLDKLAQKFPGRDNLVAQLEQKLTAQGVDYDADVKPALGPELDVGVVSEGTNASTKAVALTKPDDPAKFKALVVKLNASGSGSNAVYREVDGWYALSDSDRAIALALEGNAPLADDPDFKEAMSKLPGDALARVYLDGQRLNAIASQSSSSSGTLGLDTLKYITASASAEDDGVRIHGASSGGPNGSGDFASALIGGVPGDAFAFLGVNGQETADRLEQLEKNPQIAAVIARVEQAIGVSYDQVFSSLLSGEAAFYARPGVGIPELTLAFAPKDTSAALATLDKIAIHLAARSGGKVEPGTQGGHPVKIVNLGQFAIHYGSVDGKVLITSGVSGIADYGEGDHLPDSDDFKQAQDAAGMPDATGGVMYINLKDALPLLEGFASLSGQSLPSSTTENLRPLRSLLAWTNASGETRTFDAFLEIK
jgi:hypothetical protein